MDPNKFDKPRNIGESSIILESSMVLACKSGVKPGAIKKSKCGIIKNIMIETKIITKKNAVKVSFRNLRAEAVILPSLIRETIKGMSTVMDASEAIETNIMSGIRNAA